MLKVNVNPHHIKKNKQKKKTQFQIEMKGKTSMYTYKKTL